MSSAIARRVVRSFRRPSANPSNEAHLSTREIEVLGLLSRGLSNKEIADEMRLSFETVRSYLKTIYEKLHVRCRTEAVIRYKATPSHPSLTRFRKFARALEYGTRRSPGGISPAAGSRANLTSTFFSEMRACLIATHI